MPVLVSTWQSPQRDLLVPPNASTTIQAKELILLLKNTLVTMGWTVVSSSNTVTNDASDNWATTSDLVNSTGSTRSWMVLSNGWSQMLIYLHEAIDAYIKISPSSGFDLGTLNTTDPAASDAWDMSSNVPWGTHTSADATYLHVVATDDLSDTHWMVCREGEVSGFGYIRQLQGAISEWSTVTPHIAGLDGSSAATSSERMLASQLQGNTATVRQWTPGNQQVLGVKFRIYLSCEAIDDTDTSTRIRQHALRSGSWPDLKVGVMSIDGGFPGFLGRPADMWTGSTGTKGDVFENPASGQAGMVHLAMFSTYALPWDSAVPPLMGP